jgi:hypothetical protein
MAVADAQSEAKREPTPGYHPLVIVLAAAAAGMVVDRYRPLPLAIWCGIAASCVCGWFPFFRFSTWLPFARTLIPAMPHHATRAGAGGRAAGRDDGRCHGPHTW